MKKLIILVAGAVLSAATHAAAVGWSAANAGVKYAGDAYSFFVIGQNGTESVAAITALLDDGSSIDSYAFASGTVAAAGGFSQAANASSGKTLDAGDYEGFFVLFDSAKPVAGESNYALISGVSTLSRSVGDTTAAVTFAAGNVASFVETGKWHPFGAASGGGSDDVPEPTSGLLMVLGLAGLALKRKRA